MSSFICQELAATKEGEHLLMHNPLYRRTYEVVRQQTEYDAIRQLVASFQIACLELEQLRKERLDAWRRDPVVLHIAGNTSLEKECDV